VPAIFPLYKLMKERKSAPSDFEIAIAKGETLLTDPGVTQYLHDAFGDTDAPATFKVGLPNYLGDILLIS
jgi:hypothetical protein